MAAGVLVVICSGLVWWLTDGLLAWLAGASFLFFSAVIVNGLVSNDGSSSIDSPPAPESVPRLPGNGRFSCEVVGESNYQAALERIAGSKTEESAEHKCAAVICHEPNNAYDENACAVLVDSSVVGYLPRASAAKLVRVAEAQGLGSGFCYGVEAVIRGGWRREEDEGSFGISLDVSPSAFKVSK